MKLGVIDYGAGNLRSVLNTFEAAGVTGHLVRTPEDAAGVTHLVLPGVGAFGDCAEKLRSQELVPLIRTWIGQDRPFLGICVGYQVLFETGEEDEQVPGLGIFKGRVVRFAESELKVPHMGWNSLTLSNPADPIWKGMGPEPYFYFVHSYYPQPEDESLAAAFCTYGVSSKPWSATAWSSTPPIRSTPTAVRSARHAAWNDCANSAANRPVS